MSVTAFVHSFLNIVHRVIPIAGRAEWVTVVTGLTADSDVTDLAADLDWHQIAEDAGTHLLVRAGYHTAAPTTNNLQVIVFTRSKKQGVRGQYDEGSAVAPSSGLSGSIGAAIELPVPAANVPINGNYRMTVPVMKNDAFDLQGADEYAIRKLQAPSGGTVSVADSIIQTKIA